MPVAPLLLSLAIVSPPQELPRTCDAWVDGAYAPFMVPIHLPWNELWERADRADQTPDGKLRLGEELGVDAGAVQQILAAASARASHQPLNDIFTNYPAMLAAEASIEARDRLLELLDKTSAARVQAWVKARTAKPFQLGVRGQLTTTADGGEECRLSVLGVVHPELLPEWDAWKFFFTAIGGLGDSDVNPEGVYSNALLAGLQYQSFKAPISEIVRLLDLSRKVRALLEFLDGAPGLESRARYDEMISAVMEARWTIRTAFSQGMWDSVVFMTSGMRRGSSTDFPPFPIQKN